MTPGQMVDVYFPFDIITQMVNVCVFTGIDGFDADAVKALFAEMETEARAFVRSCGPTSEVLAEHKVYMRYAGQGWEIPVSLTAGQAHAPDAGTFLALFEADYRKLFGELPSQTLSAG